MENYLKQNTVYSILVDCEWDEWKIGECSKLCGGGKRTNIRNKKVEAAYGGTECSGDSIATETCNVGVCPGKPQSI